VAGWLVVATDFLLDPHDANGIPSSAMDEHAKQIVRGYLDWRNNVALVGPEPVEKMKHWAANGGLAAFDDVLGGEDNLLEAARVKRDQYGGVTMVLTGNPVNVRSLLMSGFKVLSLATPVYARDEHRPDYEDVPKSWAEVAAQHTGDVALHSDDPRRDDEQMDARFTT